MVRKIRIRQEQKKTGIPKTKHKDNRCGCRQCGAPNWSKQHICPVRTAESRNCRKKGHYEKMCKLPKKKHYVDKASSSAEEDNWDYSKVQTVNSNNKRRSFFHGTLLVMNAPTKLMIDSGSSITFIPQRLFKDISEVEKLNTNYKDVNDKKNRFIGQTKSTVKTINTTLQLLC